MSVIPRLTTRFASKHLRGFKPPFSFMNPLAFMSFIALNKRADRSSVHFIRSSGCWGAVVAARPETRDGWLGTTTAFAGWMMAAAGRAEEKGEEMAGDAAAPEPRSRICSARELRLDGGLWMREDENA